MYVEAYNTGIVSVMMTIDYVDDYCEDDDHGVAMAMAMAVKAVVDYCSGGGDGGEGDDDAAADDGDDDEDDDDGDDDYYRKTHLWVICVIRLGVVHKYCVATISLFTVIDVGYCNGVCSTLTHGTKAWTHTPRALAMLNGFNSRKLHRITGRSYREEATTPSYDLLTDVRTRRHQWLGLYLRMPANRLVRRSVLALGQRTRPPYQPGSLLMDTPFPLEN